MNKVHTVRTVKLAVVMLFFGALMWWTAVAVGAVDAVGYELEVWNAIWMLGTVWGCGIVLVRLIGGKDLLKKVLGSTSNSDDRQWNRISLFAVLLTSTVASIFFSR